MVSRGHGSHGHDAVDCCRGLVQKVGTEVSRLKDERQNVLQQKGELSVRAAALTQVPHLPPPPSLVYNEHDMAVAHSLPGSALCNGAGGPIRHSQSKNSECTVCDCKTDFGAGAGVLAWQPRHVPALPTCNLTRIHVAVCC